MVTVFCRYLASTSSSATSRSQNISETCQHLLETSSCFHYKKPHKKSTSLPLRTKELLISSQCSKWLFIVHTTVCIAAGGTMIHDGIKIVGIDLKKVNCVQNMESVLKIGATKSVASLTFRGFRSFVKWPPLKFYMSLMPRVAQRWNSPGGIFVASVRFPNPDFYVAAMSSWPWRSDRLKRCGILIHFASRKNWILWKQVTKKNVVCPKKVDWMWVKYFNIHSICINNIHLHIHLHMYII